MNCDIKSIELVRAVEALFKLYKQWLLLLILQLHLILDFVFSNRKEGKQVVFIIVQTFPLIYWSI